MRDNAMLNKLHWSNISEAYHDFGRHRLEVSGCTFPARVGKR